MALYYNLPVYKASYGLVHGLFRTTANFAREYKYTVGQDLKQEGTALIKNIYRANRAHDKAAALAAALVLVACVSFVLPPSARAAAPYLASGTVVSANLLGGQSAKSITDFYYDLTALPGNSSVAIQFSKDGANWYSAAGTFGGTTALSTLGGATISLSGLGWSGSAFYYRITLNATSDLTATPVLSGVRLDYVRAAGYEGMLSVDSGSGNVEVGGGEGLGGSALSVVGGVSIGSDFFSHTTTNGLIVEGWTGIGTVSPSSQLTLDGSGNGKFLEALNSTIASGKGGMVFSRYSDVSGGTDVAIGNNYYLDASGNAARQDITNSGWDIELNNRASGNSFGLNYINSSGAAGTFLTMTSAGKLGVGTTSPSGRLTVQGSDTASTTAFNVLNGNGAQVFAVYDSGNSTYSGSIFQSSDQRLKTGITSLDASSSLSLIEQLNPVSYLRLDQPGGGQNLGFIAQQVGGVFPELVSTTSPTSLTPDGTLTLNYEGLIAPIVSAIQAIAQQIAGFAESFTSKTITATNELCVDKSGGIPVCITGDQLQTILQQANQTPAPQSQQFQTPQLEAEASTNSGEVSAPPDAATSTPEDAGATAATTTDSTATSTGE